MAFTPGPWTVVIPDDERGSVLIATDKPLFEDATQPVEVARIHGRLGSRGAATCGDYRSNARLIAAAPELYSVSKSLLSALDFSGQDLRTALKAVRLHAEAAIAKAEGK